MGEFRIRRARVDDLDTLCHHRRRMFEDMGRGDAESLGRMIAAFRLWVTPKLVAGEYLAWLTEIKLTETGGEVVAGAGLWLMDWPPHLVGLPSTGGGDIPGARQHRGNVLNVYTELAYRGHGLARALMGTVLDECRRLNVGAVVLHSSDQGRALYEGLGFQPTNEMRLVL